MIQLRRRVRNGGDGGGGEMFTLPGLNVWTVCVCLIVLVTIETVLACPGQCQCNNGQVRCQGAGLRSLPQGIPQHASLLDLQDNFINEQTLSMHGRGGQLRNSMLLHIILENNHFRVLHSNVFAAINGRALAILNLQNNWIAQIAGGAFRNFGNLRQLLLGNNRLQAISPGAFHGLRSLTSLQMDQNLLTHIPFGLFNPTPHIMELSISRNRLQALSGCVFANLSMLRDLELDHNALGRIDENAFAGLSNMRNLDLDRNRITTLQSCLFADLVSLVTLDIDHNLIQQVHPNAFVGLQSLQQLNIFRNRITNLPNGVFAELPHLYYIDISQNGISQLTPTMFNDISNISLRLEGNPLLCNCALLWLQWLAWGNQNSQNHQWQSNWGNNNNNGQQHQVEGAVCFSPPQMQGNNLDGSQIQCNLPRSMTVMPAQLVIRPRGSAHFVCLQAVQGHEVQWMRNGQHIQHRPNVIMNEGLLSIRHVTQHDAGRYTCTSHGQNGNTGHMGGQPGMPAFGPGVGMPPGGRGMPPGGGVGMPGGVGQPGMVMGGPGMLRGGGFSGSPGQLQNHFGRLEPLQVQSTKEPALQVQTGKDAAKEPLQVQTGKDAAKEPLQVQTGKEPAKEPLQVQQAMPPGQQGAVSQGAPAGTLTVRNTRPASHMCTAAATTLSQPGNQRRATLIARCSSYSGPAHAQQPNILAHGGDVPVDGGGAMPPNLPGWSACGPDCRGTATRWRPSSWLLLCSMFISLLVQRANRLGFPVPFVT
eukprot:scpid33823/ scgid1475/ Leucine-rich repeat-containing protein 70; Synleurin